MSDQLNHQPKPDTQPESKKTIWSKLLEDYRQSGNSAKSFCAEKGISIHTFKYWQQKLRNSDGDNPKSSDSGSFLPINLNGPSGQNFSCEICLSNRVVIRFGNDLSVDRLRLILKTLGEV